MNRRLCSLIMPLLLLVQGCAGPQVRLATPEPIEVDITMRVDIYQHGGAAGVVDKSSRKEEDTAVSQRRRARMGEIQAFKNARLVGENRDGLLTLRKDPGGTYGQHVQTTVAAENADRLATMKALAAERGQTLATVQAQQGELWRNRSFHGEWIEVPAAGGWQWRQKD